jgi:Cu(I)/Ag(I) efflux system membrane fusion protein
LTSRSLGIAAAVLGAFLLGLLVRSGGPTPEATDPAAAGAAAGSPTLWTCSMHPQIQLPEPGQCPICFMDLIPVESHGEEDLGPRTLEMTETAAALAEIRTTPVRRMVVDNEVRLVGKVAYDETRYRTISAWVGGRIDTLFVDFTGTSVRKGEKLVSLYSPDLYAAQVELLNAREAQQALEQSDQELMRRTARATVVAARDRLRLWGLSDEQIDAIEQRGTASYHVTIRAPIAGVVVHKNAVEGMYVQTGTRIYTVADLSHVWVDLDAYESDLVWLKEGQSIDFTVEALPGRRFTGAVVFIDPVLDDKTRTVTVRLDAANARRLLKPGMFVHAVVNARLRREGAPPAETDEEKPLVIPASAPLLTGKRAVVYVRLPEHEKPTFEGREIVLGPRAGDHYVVEVGLQEGELVVVQGAFKIDSALQIQAKPSMMSPVDDAPAPDHGHDGEPVVAAGKSDADRPSSPAMAAHDHGGDDEGGEDRSGASERTFEVPAGFRAQLRAVLDGYLALQTALAGDDDAAAAAAARRAEEALAAVDMSLLAGNAHAAWMEDLAALREPLRAVRAAAGIAGRRSAFQPLSDRLWGTLRRFGYQDERTVRLFHCPMADENRGADWIQIATTTANPYYGASMLRCGSQTDSLAAAVGDGEVR